MQLNEHQGMGDLSDVIQLPLWPDDELPDAQLPAQDEEQDGQEQTSSPVQEDPPTIQLYLPGFEPE